MYLALDMGGQSIKYATISSEGKIIESNSVVTPKTYEEFLNFLKELAEKYKDIIGVGGSFPGAVDNDSGYIKGISAIPYIHGPHIKKDIENIFSKPVSIINDANAAGIGEIWNGAAKGKKNILFMVIGTGIGGAVIADGKLMGGHNLLGGEFGLMVLGAENNKTLSDTSGTMALMNRYAKLTGEKLEDVNGELIFKNYENGNKNAIESVEYMVSELVKSIWTLQYCFDPECIIIGGAISSNPKFIEMLKVGVDKLYNEFNGNNDNFNLEKIVNILPAQNGNNANLFGAVKYLLSVL